MFFLSAIKFTTVKPNNVLSLYSICKSITLHKSPMMSKCDDIGRKMGPSIYFSITSIQDNESNDYFNYFMTP